MGDKINNEFDEYQKDLIIREKKLKMVVHFPPPDDKLEQALEELKQKKLTL